MEMHADEKEGVILLHGLCRTANSMEAMEERLEQAGFEVLNVDYESREATVSKLSETVVGGALKQSKELKWTKVHFVAHSLGGIMIRDYFKDHEDPRLGRVVMLGPPNRGSEVVDHMKDWSFYKWLNGPAGQELGTDKGSKPNELGPVEFELGVIAGDRSINWINSSTMIPGKDDGKVSVEHTKVEGMKEHRVVHVTHPYLMKRKEPIELTLRFLKGGTFGER